MKGIVTVALIFGVLVSFGQDKTFLWDRGDSGLGFWNKAINCGNNNQPGGAQNTKGSKVTFGVTNKVRFANSHSVELWTNSNYEETCNQNFTAERAETSSYASYRDMGAQEGATVWMGWSELWDEVDETHTATVLQFRSNCGSGSPAVEVYMRPNRQLQLQARGSGASINLFSPDLDEWYDIVVEMKYSKSTSGYINFWYKKASESTYSKKSLPNVKTMLPDDNCPHIRWGVYRWQSGDKKPAQIPVDDRMMIKYVGPTRLHIGQNAFDLVKPDGGSVPEPPDEEPEVEVPVETGRTDLTNYALTATATQSSTYGDGSASLAIDGVLNGDNPWGSDANISHTRDDLPSWLKIELDTARLIEEVIIHNRKDQFAKRIDGAVLSLDNVPIGTLDNEFIQTFSVGRIGKSVQLQVENFLHISEIQVWGKPIADTLLVDMPCEWEDSLITYTTVERVVDTVYFVQDTLMGLVEIDLANEKKSLPFEWVATKEIREKFPIIREESFTVKVCKEKNVVGVIR